MKTVFRTITDIIDDKELEKECPISISTIPNNMGINLCAVDGISWTRQDDKQLVSATIHFVPSPETRDHNSIV